MLNLSDSDNDYPTEEIDEEIGDDLEEGEFVLPEDWTTILQTEVDEGIDLDANIDEHIVDPSTTEFLIQDEHGELAVDLEAFENESTESDSEDVFDKQKDNPMFKPLAKKKKMKTMIKEVDITGKRVPRKGILGWYYDSDLKLFAIKRFDGVQYFERKLVVFNSLPRYEIRDLARLPLKNHSNDIFVRYVEHIIKTEGRSMKFVKLKPRKGKTIKLNERSQRTGRRLRKKIYPKVKCIQQIPLKQMPQDILGNMKRWHVEVGSGEAVMFEADDEVEGCEKEIFRIYDNRHLVNLSKNDLLVLYKNSITATEGWEDLARDYQRIVKRCIRLRIYAGSKMYK